MRLISTSKYKIQGVIKFSFLQGKAPKEIHACMIETLREHAPLYAVKNWLAQCKLDFFSCDAPRPGLTKSVNP
jgi:hypothetical protein